MKECIQYTRSFSAIVDCSKLTFFSFSVVSWAPPFCFVGHWKCWSCTYSWRFIQSSCSQTFAPFGKTS